MVASSPPSRRAAIQQLWVLARQAELRADWAAAVAAYRQAAALEPENPIFPTNLANALWWAGGSDDPEALAASRQACRLAPQDAKPWLGLGNILRDLNRYEDADRAYAQAMAQADDANTAWNHSQTLIGLERYGEAFALAERRLELAERLQPFRSGPYWQGWPPAQPGAAPLPPAITVWSEQGFGDTLQYARWLVPLLQRRVRVRLEVEAPMRRLIEQGLAWLDGPLEVVSKDAPPPLGLAETPCQGSLLSLPHRLGGAPLAEAFAVGGAYLQSPAWRQPPRWRLRPRGASRRERPRIGLVWAAGRKHNDPFTSREYARRSLPAPVLQQLLAGLAGRGAALVNLQHGADQERAGRWRRRFAATLPADADFADTAHWIAHLDLVITVDTAYAHLVGAMGRPGWVLLPHGPDPRWLRQRSDSPWYPSLRLWRQPQPGDWGAVVEAVLAQLDRGGVRPDRFALN